MAAFELRVRAPATLDPADTLLRVTGVVVRGERVKLNT